MVLAQLMIKAICLLENIRVTVDGVVSYGASTNRKLWIELGVSGQKSQVKNSFDHPLLKKKGLHVFGCTTPD